MTKRFLLFIIFMQAGILFGQTYDWGNWNVSKCYSGIQNRVKLVSNHYYSGGSASADGCNDGQGYQWNVQIKNTYSRTVWISFAAGRQYCIEKNVYGGDGLILGPGEIGQIPLKDWYSDNTDAIYVIIKSLAFLSSKNDESYKNDPSLQWEKCGDGRLCQVCIVNPAGVHCPNYQTSGKVNVNDANGVITKQNDLSDYNRSKAEMEQKLQEENKRRQQQANQKQSYINAINAGVAANNAGNYTEAKSQFNTAINLAQTSEERAKAQEYYNHTTSANKSQEQIKAVGNFAQTLITTLGQASEERKRKREAEAAEANERKEREQQEKARRTENLEHDWQQANSLAGAGTNDGYQSAIELMLPYANAGEINGMALNTIGFWYWKTQDYTNAKKWYEAGAGKNDANAMYNLAVLYENGEGVNKDIVTAAEWYKKACEKGYDAACKNAENANNQVLAIKQEKNKWQPLVTTKTVDENITIKFIIDKYVTAIGGDENIKAVKTITQIDEFNSEGRNESRRTITAYGKFYQESTNQDKQFKFVFNGIGGYSGYNGKKEVLSQDMIASHKDKQPFEILGFKQTELKLGNIETINGDDCYTIIVPTAQRRMINTVKSYYFDIKSGLWRGTKLEFVSLTKSNTSYISSKFYYLFDDYRVVDNITFPFSMFSFSTNDERTSKTTVKEIRINEQGIDAIFE